MKKIIFVIQLFVFVAIGLAAQVDSDLIYSFSSKSNSVAEGTKPSKEILETSQISEPILSIFEFVETGDPVILLCPAYQYPICTSHLAYGFVDEDYYLHAFGDNLSSNDADYKWKFYSSDPYELPVSAIGKQVHFRKSTPGNYLVSLQYNGEDGWSDEIFKTIIIEDKI